MSYGLMVYSVNLDHVVTAVLGSNDDALLRTILQRFRTDLQQLAEWFEDEIEDGAPTPAEAVGALIRGEALEDYGFMYAYAFELIVRHFGRPLDNGPFYPCDTEFLEDVDAALADLGAPDELLTESLQYGDLPVELPPPDDFPGSGHWPASLVATAHAQIGDAEVPDTLDESVAEAVTAVQGWLREAASRGEAIVGFYY
ncbi:MAG TPA: hypothetical protein VM869_08140 [Enhygromyxa sp.]|nr:hypothetical protein [Enhygromyxa sp.]